MSCSPNVDWAPTRIWAMKSQKTTCYRWTNKTTFNYELSVINDYVIDESADCRRLSIDGGHIGVGAQSTLRGHVPSCSPYPRLLRLWLDSDEWRRITCLEGSHGSRVQNNKKEEKNGRNRQLMGWRFWLSDKTVLKFADLSIYGRRLVGTKCSAGTAVVTDISFMELFTGVSWRLSVFTALTHAVHWGL